MEEPSEKSFLVLSLREGERVAIGEDIDILVGFYEGSRTRIKICVSAPRALLVKRLGSGNLSRPKDHVEVVEATTVQRKAEASDEAAHHKGFRSWTP